jgi:hypothetical protein
MAPGLLARLLRMEALRVWRERPARYAVSDDTGALAVALQHSDVLRGEIRGGIVGREGRRGRSFRG